MHFENRLLFDKELRFVYNIDFKSNQIFTYRIKFRCYILRRQTFMELSALRTDNSCIISYRYARNYNYEQERKLLQRNLS